jgi:hypothetical protein
MILLYTFYSCCLAGEMFSDGKDLGKWWLMSSKRHETMPDPILYHLVGKYAFTDLSGNADVRMQNADVSAIFRKNIFTSQTVYGQKRQRTILSIGPKGPKHTFFMKQNFAQIMTVDLIPDLSFQCGVAWQYDTSKYIEDRYTYFGGLLTQQVIAKYVNLSIGAYYGRDDTTYDNNGIRGLLDASVPITYKEIEPYETDGLRLVNHLSFPITKTIYFMQSADYMTYFKNSEYYHLTLDFTVNFVIVKGLSFFVKYKTDYENNIYIDYGTKFLDKLNNFLVNVGKPAMGNLFKDNDMFVVGVQLSM